MARDLRMQISGRPSADGFNGFVMRLLRRIDFNILDQNILDLKYSCMGTLTKPEAYFFALVPYLSWLSLKTK